MYRRAYTGNANNETSLRERERESERERERERGRKRSWLLQYGSWDRLTRGRDSRLELRPRLFVDPTPFIRCHGDLFRGKFTGRFPLKEN